MPSGLLTLLKYVFLVVLYLFFLRVLRAVWVELREPKPSEAVPDPASPLPPAPGAAPAPPHGPARSAPAPAPAPAGAPAGPMLRVVAPPDRLGQQFALGDELTVGRAPGCGVSLPEDTFVSQLHARVFRRQGSLWVEDLGSTNGTLLNDRPVSAAVAMAPGDVLQVGRTSLELVP